MKKYYLITYGLNSGGYQADHYTVVSELSPIEFIKKQNDKSVNKYKTYHLVFAMEITESEFLNFANNGA